MSQEISVMNRSGACIFYTYQTSAVCAGVYTCNRMHQMEKSDKVHVEMCLEITYSVTAKYPKNFFDALKPDQNAKS